MATYRRPKGSYVRATPDFFGDRAATVGGVYVVAPPDGVVFDLFNNASDGSYLYVYELWVGNEAGEAYGVTRLKGHGANFLQNAVPVFTDGPTLPGELYQDTIGPLFVGIPAPPGFVHSDALIGDNVAGSVDIYSTVGPLCVLTPGYSLRVYAITGTGYINPTQLGCSFYFLALHGTN